MNLTIQGLGPHDNTQIDIGSGCTEVSGPSESGKSTTLDALCFVLWGTDRSGSPLSADAIRDGAPAVEVSVAIGGKVFRRRMTRSRSITREVTSGEVSRRVGTEAEWSAELGAFGAKDVALPILSPSVWTAMAVSAGGGRDLRDYLARLLKADTAAWLAARLKEGEPTTVKAAELWRRDAKRAAAEAHGAARVRRQSLAEAEAEAPDAPDADEVEAARARIAATRAAGERRARAVETVRANRETVDAARRARSGWEHRRATLPGRPDGDRPTHEAIAQAAARLADATAAGERARAEHDAAMSAHRDAVRSRIEKIDAASNRVVALSRAAELAGRVPCRGAQLQALTSDDADPVPVDCGACPLLTDAVAARAELPDARTAVTEARALVTPPEPSSAALEEARAAFLAAREANTALVAAEDAWSRHEAALAALGEEPQVPDLDTVEPPQVPAVDARDLAIVSDADAHERLAAAHAARVQAAREASEAAGVALALADATAARAEEVVRLVRSAPGEALREQLSTLDAAPLTIEVPDADAPDSIRVLIDGRPWPLASTGRRVVAGLALRSALREASNVPDLPLFVDNAQAVGGQPMPRVPGPAVYLRTTHGAKLEVSHAVAAVAT